VVLRSSRGTPQKQNKNLKNGEVQTAGGAVDVKVHHPEKGDLFESER